MGWAPNPQDCVLTEGALATDTCGESHVRRKVWVALRDCSYQKWGWEALASPSTASGRQPRDPLTWDSQPPDRGGRLLLLQLPIGAECRIGDQK